MAIVLIFLKIIMVVNRWTQLTNIEIGEYSTNISCIILESSLTTMHNWIYARTSLYILSLILISIFVSLDGMRDFGELTKFFGYDLS